ncbi:Transposon Tf2-9 polyprotein, partial [Araneus ventricosus]
IHPSTSKVRPIHEAQEPKNKTEQVSLGLLNFYRSFLKDKAIITESLHRLLEKNSEWKRTSAHEKAFAAVKELLSSDSVLVPFNEKFPLILTCDASSYDVGYVLSHLMPNGREAPIAYASRKLTSTDRNYSQLHKEAPSIIADVKKCHYFLYGHTLSLVTDHKPLLRHFNRMKLTPDILSPCMLRWSQMLNAYNFNVINRPGKKIQNADALSRLPLETPKTDIPLPHDVLFLEELYNPSVKADEISQATLRYTVLSRVLNWVIKGWPESEKNVEFCTLIVMNFLFIKIVMRKRIVIPQVLRGRVLDELHISHPRIVKLKSLAR